MNITDPSIDPLINDTEISDITNYVLLGITGVNLIYSFIKKFLASKQHNTLLDEINIIKKLVTPTISKIESVIEKDFKTKQLSVPTHLQTSEIKINVPENNV